MSATTPSVQRNMDMCDEAQEMSCLASRHEDTMVPPAAAGQRSINHWFEFQVQAISADKLPFVLHAVVVFSTIAPIAAAAAAVDDLARHFSNDDDHVRRVIERDTLALAASMTMEEILRATTSSSVVFEFHSVQLELKQLGRLVVYDACVYVKPHSVDVYFSYGAQQAQVEDEAQSSSVEGGSNQEGQQSKMGQIMGWACQSLKPQILQVVCADNDTTSDEIKQQIKFLSSYSLKALWFAMPMFYVSLTHHYSTSTGFGVRDTLFLVAISTDAALILLLPKWGNALVCISWLLLELATCLLILSFNKHYAFAILAAVLLAVVVALLQPKLQHAADRHVLPFFTQDMIGDDEGSPHMGHLLELSQGIASFGGLSMAIAGRFMVGPVNVVGFFFFCAIALGLYLSMVVTVGAVSRPHAKCLAIVVMVLVVLTFIAACIPFFGHSGSKP